MSKRVYISADYSEEHGDRDVVDILNQWGTDNLHIVNFIDMSKVISGSVSNNPDCRICDLKQEFNEQINASSAVIFVIGDKTKFRTAGSNCSHNNHILRNCTPYKQNANGSKTCKVFQPSSLRANDVSNINTYSYLQHEFEQAKKQKKSIIVLYNSSRKELNWLPSYMKDYELDAQPFWTINNPGKKVGNYAYIKSAIEYA